MREAIIAAIFAADDHVRQYGDGQMSREELYADFILGRVSEMARVDDVEKVLSEHARYKRALEYIANAPVSTETEIVLQGRAMIGLLDREPSDDDD